MTTDTTEIKTVSRLSLVNPTDSEMTLVLEPWGEPYPMPAGALFRVVAEGPEGNDLEVAFDEGSITVWAWPGATVRLYHGDVELGGTPKGRRPMPQTAAETPAVAVTSELEARAVIETANEIMLTERRRLGELGEAVTLTERKRLAELGDAVTNEVRATLGDSSVAFLNVLVETKIHMQTGALKQVIQSDTEVLAKVEAVWHRIDDVSELTKDYIYEISMNHDPSQLRVAFERIADAMQLLYLDFDAVSSAIEVLPGRS